MHRTNVNLDDEQLRALKDLAAEEGSSVAELVRRAVDGYLGQRRRAARAWGERFDTVVARFRAGVPAELTPDEIEAEITAARAEYRAERAAARRFGGTADAGGR